MAGSTLARFSTDCSCFPVVYTRSAGTKCVGREVLGAGTVQVPKTDLETGGGTTFKQVCVSGMGRINFRIAEEQKLYRCRVWAYSCRRQTFSQNGNIASLRTIINNIQ